MTDVIPLATAQAQLTAWLAASIAVASNQAYEIQSGDSMRRLTRADAAEIRSQIVFWQNMVARLMRKQAGRSRTRNFVPQ
jgi:hypothetical protein